MTADGVQLQQPGNQPEGVSGVSGRWCSLWLTVWNYIGGRWCSLWFIVQKVKVKSCPTLCDHMDYSLPDFSVNGIFQARTLEWVAISFSRRSSQPRDQTQVSRIIGRCFTIWATRKVNSKELHVYFKLQVLLYFDKSIRSEVWHF